MRREAQPPARPVWDAVRDRVEAPADGVRPVDR